MTKLNTQIVTKLKKSNCDKNLRLKLWQNLKTQSFTKLLTQIVTKVQQSNFYETQKLKFWQLQQKKLEEKKYIYDKTQFMKKL